MSKQKKVAVFSLERPFGGFENKRSEEQEFLAHGRLYHKGYQVTVRGQVSLYVLQELSESNRVLLESQVPHNYEVDRELEDWFREQDYEVVHVRELDDTDKF